MKRENCFCEKPLTTVLMTWMTCSRCKADGRLPTSWIKFNPMAYRLDGEDIEEGIYGELRRQWRDVEIMELES